MPPFSQGKNGINIQAPIHTLDPKFIQQCYNYV